MSSQFVIEEDGIYEVVTHTAKKKITTLADIAKKEAEKLIANNLALVTKNVATFEGCRVHMVTFKDRLVFAKRFDQGPLGLRVWLLSNGSLSKLGQNNRPEAEVVFDENFWLDVPAGIKPPEHWVTYCPKTGECTLILYYNKQTYHPLTTNVYSSGKICTGDSIKTRLENYKKDYPHSSVFEHFRVVFGALTESPWNDDLRNYGFHLLSHDGETVNKFSVNNLLPLSHADHHADIFN